MLALNDALRSAIAATRVSQAPESVLAEAARLVAAAVELLGPHRHPGPHQQAGFEQLPAVSFSSRQDLDPAEYFPFSPIIGPLNPVASPAVLWREPDPDPHHPAGAGLRVGGTMRLGATYAGPPSTVHGGVVALVFDELLGVCGVVNGAGAMTGTLTIRYRRPTPLDEVIELSSWVERVEGRKVFIDGTMHHEGELTAEAHGIFIRLPDST